MAAIRMNNGVPILNGTTLAFDDNENCCCTAAVANVCTGNTCSGSNDPNMQLTVSGASGTVDWCGEIWNLPADSGDTRCVCPTTYNQFRSAVPTASNRWAYGSSLQMLRNSYSGTFDQQNSLRLNPVGAVDSLDLWRFYLSTVYSSFNALGFISTVPFATYSDYLITNEYFGSHTTGGITYTWDKGINWP
jgi:hypothetical protein